MFLILTRARFSDAMSLAAEPSASSDGVWVEVATKNYKTSRAQGRQGRELPLLAPNVLHGICWGSAWLTARQATRCNAGDGDLFIDGAKTLAGVANAEANLELRKLVTQCNLTCYVENPMDAHQYGTHSCKRTTLHWIAISGMGLDECRLLGHHVIRAGGSWMAYSKDLMFTLTKKYVEVLEKVLTTRSWLMVRRLLRQRLQHLHVLLLQLW